MSVSAHVAIVTGTSGGIGRGAAERLARNGLVVVVGYTANPDRAEEAVSAITAAGGTASAFRADIAEAVAFPAGPGCRWVNGQVIYVNGGAA